MSATTDQMTAALDGIEAALVALGTAYASYESGRQTAKGARAAALGVVRAEDIDNAVSTAQLNRVIAGRMCALGLEHTLLAPTSVGRQEASWTAAWGSKVQSVVP